MIVTMLYGICGGVVRQFYSMSKDFQILPFDQEVCVFVGYSDVNVCRCQLAVFVIQCIGAGSYLFDNYICQIDGDQNKCE